MVGDDIGQSVQVPYRPLKTSVRGWEITTARINPNYIQRGVRVRGLGREGRENGRTFADGLFFSANARR